MLSFQELDTYKQFSIQIRKQIKCLHQIILLLLFKIKNNNNNKKLLSGNNAVFIPVVLPSISCLSCSGLQHDTI